MNSIPIRAITCRTGKVPPYPLPQTRVAAESRLIICLSTHPPTRRQPVNAALERGDVPPPRAWGCASAVSQPGGASSGALRCLSVHSVIMPRVGSGRCPRGCALPKPYPASVAAMVWEHGLPFGSVCEGRRYRSGARVECDSAIVRKCGSAECRKAVAPSAGRDGPRPCRGPMRGAYGGGRARKAPLLGVALGIGRRRAPRQPRRTVPRPPSRPPAGPRLHPSARGLPPVGSPGRASRAATRLHPRLSSPGSSGV